MKIRQVTYFLALCEEQSFTRAARRCGVAQPSLTRAIQLLEQEIGGRLFARSNLSVRLTELGRSKARELVRRHRQWEQYLVEQAALRPDHVHPTAERLEHVKDPDLAARLAAENPAPQDPHGRPIP